MTQAFDKVFQEGLVFKIRTMFSKSYCVPTDPKYHSVTFADDTAILAVTETIGNSTKIFARQIKHLDYHMENQTKRFEVSAYSFQQQLRHLLANI